MIKISVLLSLFYWWSIWVGLDHFYQFWLSCVSTPAVHSFGSIGASWMVEFENPRFMEGIIQSHPKLSVWVLSHVHDVSVWHLFDTLLLYQMWITTQLVTRSMLRNQKWGMWLIIPEIIQFSDWNFDYYHGTIIQNAL